MATGSPRTPPSSSQKEENMTDFRIIQSGALEQKVEPTSPVVKLTYLPCVPAPNRPCPDDKQKVEPSSPVVKLTYLPSDDANEKPSTVHVPLRECLKGEPEKNPHFLRSQGSSGAETPASTLEAGGTRFQTTPPPLLLLLAKTPPTPPPSGIQTGAKRFKQTPPPGPELLVAKTLAQTPPPPGPGILSQVACVHARERANACVRSRAASQALLAKTPPTPQIGIQTGATQTPPPPPPPPPIGIQTGATQTPPRFATTPTSVQTGGATKSWDTTPPSATVKHLPLGRLEPSVKPTAVGAEKLATVKNPPFQGGPIPMIIASSHQKEATNQQQMFERIQKKFDCVSYSNMMECTRYNFMWKISDITKSLQAGKSFFFESNFIKAQVGNSSANIRMAFFPNGRYKDYLRETEKFCAMFIYPDNIALVDTAFLCQCCVLDKNGER